MKQNKAVLKTEQIGLQSGKSSKGFIILVMIPVFLAILTFATAITGCISCSIQAMAHRNEMIQAYSILEDDNADWQNEIRSVSWKEIQDGDYEKVSSLNKDHRFNFFPGEYDPVDIFF